MASWIICNVITMISENSRKTNGINMDLQYSPSRMNILEAPRKLLKLLRENDLK